MAFILNFVRRLTALARAGLIRALAARIELQMKATIEKSCPPFYRHCLRLDLPLAALIRQVYGLSASRSLRPVYGRYHRTLCESWSRRSRTLGRKFRLSRALVPWCVWRPCCRSCCSCRSALARVVVGAIRFEVSALSLLSLVVAFSSVGEEVGWRGFPALSPSALPALDLRSDRRLVWAVWHLPNFLLPNYPIWAAIFGHRVMPWPLNIVYVALPQHGGQPGDCRDLSCRAQPFFASWRGAVKAVLAQGCGIYCGSPVCERCYAQIPEVGHRFGARQLTSHSTGARIDGLPFVSLDA